MVYDKARLPLGDSWVVEEHDDTGEESPAQEEPEFTPIPRRTSPRKRDTSSSEELPVREEPKYTPTQRRTSPRKRGTPEESPALEDPTRLRSSPRKRETRSSRIKAESVTPKASRTRPPDPEFVMPSIDNNSMDGSRSDFSSGSAYRTSARASTYQEPQRRSARLANSNNAPRRNVSENAPAGSREPEGNAFETAAGHVGKLLSLTIDIITGALGILKTPIQYLVAAAMLAGAAIAIRNMVMNSIYSSLSPVCAIPGVSLLSLPFCDYDGINHGSQRVASPEFDELMKAQSRFEEVMVHASEGVSLPLDMKRGETSIRDLRQLVKFSHLQAKNELVLEFDGFIESARIASHDLQKFNSRIGRAVDQVLATTRWTTRVLDNLLEQQTGEGLINKVLSPFRTVGFSEQLLLDQYILHTRTVEEEISKLILEANALLSVLNNLEDRLEIIQGISTQEGHRAKASRDEILGELWTIVGGNRAKIGKMDSQLALLQQVGLYRQMAIRHVTETVVKLQGIEADLSSLRDRVAGPGLTRDAGMSVPLEVHIESITRGVERLEEGRVEARRVENENVRRALDHQTVGGRQMEIEGK